MGKAASQSRCDLMKVGGPLLSEHELDSWRGERLEQGDWKEGTMWQEPWAQTEKICVLSFCFAAYWLQGLEMTVVSFSSSVQWR